MDLCSHQVPEVFPPQFHSISWSNTRPSLHMIHPVSVCWDSYTSCSVDNTLLRCTFVPGTCEWWWRFACLTILWSYRRCCGTWIDPLCWYHAGEESRDRRQYCESWRWDIRLAASLLHSRGALDRWTIACLAFVPVFWMACSGWQGRKLCCPDVMIWWSATLRNVTLMSLKSGLWTRLLLTRLKGILPPYW